MQGMKRGRREMAKGQLTSHGCERWLRGMGVLYSFLVKHCMAASSARKGFLRSSMAPPPDEGPPGHAPALAWNAWMHASECRPSGHPV